MWIAELHQSYPQKRYWYIQNTTEQQNTTDKNTNSHKQSTTEKAELDRLPTIYPTIEGVNRSTDNPKEVTMEHRKSK